MEVLKQIEGFNGNYFVSNIGNVYSKANGEFELKNTFDSHGYRRVKLWCNGKSKNFLIHRLVAQYFIKNPNNLETVDHINGDKKDNRKENLRWMTHEYNSARNKTHLTDAEVRYIRQNYKRGNGTILANKFNIDLSALCRIAKGLTYKWVI